MRLVRHRLRGQYNGLFLEYAFEDRANQDPFSLSHQKGVDNEYQTWFECR
jgi:hypothetical protein